jgi:hypothetical protein
MNYQNLQHIFRHDFISGMHMSREEMVLEISVLNLGDCEDAFRNTA